jgi:hypothetical protein
MGFNKKWEILGSPPAVEAVAGRLNVRFSSGVVRRKRGEKITITRAECA